MRVSSAARHQHFDRRVRDAALHDKAAQGKLLPPTPHELNRLHFKLSSEENLELLSCSVTRKSATDVAPVAQPGTLPKASKTKVTHVLPPAPVATRRRQPKPKLIVIKSGF